MEGNVCFVTKKGLVFGNLSQKRTQEMIQCVEQLKHDREMGQKYQFVINFDDGRRVVAKDVWLAIGAEIGNY